MGERAQDAPARRSLATARAGEAIEVGAMLFPSIRDLCHDLGLMEGDVVICRSDTGTHVLLLETTSHRTIMLDRDWARFVQVRAA